METEADLHRVGSASGHYLAALSVADCDSVTYWLRNHSALRTRKSQRRSARRTPASRFASDL